MSLQEGLQPRRGQDTRPNDAVLEELQKVAFETFSGDWPALLREHNGKWVAYHGAERLGISDDDLALYELGRQSGLSPRSMLVIGIDPEADQIPVIHEHQLISPE
jgi:hypothetical protein